MNWLDSLQAGSEVIVHDTLTDRHQVSVVDYVTPCRQHISVYGKIYSGKTGIELCATGLINSRLLNFDA